MRRKFPRPIAVFAVLIAALAAAHAGSFMMSFEVTGFTVSNGNPPPTDPVSGTIIWQAAGIHDPIQSFNSINLTLDGHSYSIEEIGIPPSDYPWPDGVIGGNLHQVYGLWDQTDDFAIQWNPASLTPFSFTYTSAQKSGMWFVSINNPVNFTAFSITEIPEPTAIIPLGLGVLGAWRWRQRRFIFYMPNKSLQPTPGGAGTSAFAGHVTVPAWLSLGR